MALSYQIEIDALELKEGVRDGRDCSDNLAGRLNELRIDVCPLIPSAMRNWDRFLRNTVTRPTFFILEQTQFA